MAGTPKPSEMIAVAGLIVAGMGAVFTAVSLIITIGSLSGADVILTRALLALGISAATGVIGLAVAAIASTKRGGIR